MFARITRPLLILMVLMLAAGCAAPATETALPPTEAPAVAAAATNTAARAVESALPATQAVVAVAATDMPAATEAATEAGPAATRTPRLHLEATAPGTVTLAAGRPQLVEFFAFW
jgi:hypothetical protein